MRIVLPGSCRSQAAARKKPSAGLAALLTTVHTEERGESSTHFGVGREKVESSEARPSHSAAPPGEHTHGTLAAWPSVFRSVDGYQRSCLLPPKDRSGQANAGYLVQRAPSWGCARIYNDAQEHKNENSRAFALARDGASAPPRRGSSGSAPGHHVPRCHPLHPRAAHAPALIAFTLVAIALRRGVRAMPASTSAALAAREVRGASEHHVPCFGVRVHRLAAGAG